MFITANIVCAFPVCAFPVRVASWKMGLRPRITFARTGLRAELATIYTVERMFGVVRRLADC